MKKIININKINYLKLLALQFVVFLIASCTKSSKVEFTDGQSSYAPYHPDTTIIVWKNPDATQAEFNQWKQNHNLTINKKVAIQCPFCDDDDPLELYAGISIQTLIQGNGTGGSGTGCTGTHCGPSGGGDDTAFFSYNLTMLLPNPTAPVDSLDSNDKIIENNKKNYPVPQNINLESQDRFPGQPVTVAVFDTGIDTILTNKYCSGLSTVCDPRAARGWNYNYGSPNTQDDYPHRHGSAVAKFIIDQVIQYQNQKVNIIPVKIHDSLGRSNLYNVLCAIAYASKSHVNIINASFGFYWDDPNSTPLLLGEFIKHYLTKQGILMIAAAGNRDYDEDTFVLNHNLVSWPQLRDLDVHPFYPASFAGRDGFDNVIAVTTCEIPSYDSVSQFQNYSNNFVDAAVNCDVPFNLTPLTSSLEFGFFDPLNRPIAGGGQLIIAGSSYSTPIITGKIAAYYDILINGMIGAATANQIDKNELFRRMEASGLIHLETVKLSSKIKGGKYAIRTAVYQ
jgi:Subtilase family